MIKTKFFLSNSLSLFNKKNEREDIFLTETNFTLSFQEFFKLLFAILAKAQDFGQEQTYLTIYGFFRKISSTS